MPGRVFISCGQRPGKERSVAKKVADLLQSEFGLTTYLAFRIQSLDDIMTITKELSASDYYLFIDFCRDPSSRDDLACSLFTHQELALAHHLGFHRNMIALQEANAPLEGFLKYVLGNPRSFTTEAELLDIVKEEVAARGWSADFSRNLVVVDMKHVDCQYGDHTGQAQWRVWQVYLENRRPDLAAVDTVCILDEIKYGGSVTGHKSLDRAYLKWAGVGGYSLTILPKDFGIVNVFAARADSPGVFLHSLRDVVPREPIITMDGEYELIYKVFAHGFPLLNFTMKFCVKTVWQKGMPTEIQAQLLV